MPVDFNYVLLGSHQTTALLNSNLETQQVRSAPKNSASTSIPFTGIMQITDQIANVMTTHTWYLNINPDTLEVSSLKTVLLSPGSYEFYINVQSGNRQYVGQGVHTVTDKDALSLPLSLSPLLKSIYHQTSTATISQMARMRFKFDAVDLAKFSTPMLSISIDNTNHVLMINKETGQNSVYFDIDQGRHSFSIALFESNKMIARTETPEIDLNIYYGDDVSIGLVPLYAEASFVFSNDNVDELEMIFRIPEVVISEAGGLSNADILLKYTYDGENFEKIKTIALTCSHPIMLR